MIKSLDRLPKMSPVTTRLLARLARPDCDLNELASLVERDPLLSGQLLRIANSARFGRRQKIERIPHAIAMVGLSVMRKMALGASIVNLFSHVKTAPSFSLRRFNAHSVATATMVELYASEGSFENAQSAFVAGLLHDVGKLLIAISAPEAYEAILSMSLINGTSFPILEAELLSLDHAELSGLAIARWELSEAIQLAAGYHHDPEKGQLVERPAPGKLGLSMAVHKANLFVNYLGMSVLHNPQTPTEVPTLGVPGFPIDEARVLKRFEGEWEQLSDLFG
jgi:HD-like signal output (HDOD) protein